MSIQEHIADLSNPHQDSKEKIGLGNIQNFPLATRAEVMALSSNERYIDNNNLGWVGEAFIQYMKDLKILDANGEYLDIPTDNLGTVIFYRTPSEDSVLFGTHPEAVSLSYKIFLENTVISTVENIILSNGTWSNDIATTNLNDNANYRLEIEYKRADGSLYSNGVYYYISTETQTQLQVDILNEKLLVSGAVQGYDKINVEILEDNQVIRQVNNISTNLGGWTIDLSAIVVDLAKEYKVRVTHFINNVELETFTELAVEKSVPDGTLYYIDPESGDEYYDFRRVENLSDVGLYYVDLGELN